MNVDLFPAGGDDEVNLPGHGDLFSLGVALGSGDYAYVHGTAPNFQVVEEDVLHDVGHLLLAESNAGVPQAHVLAVVLVGVIEVVLALDVVPLALRKEESVRQVVHVGLHRVDGHQVLPATLLGGVDG